MVKRLDIVLKIVVLYIKIFYDNFLVPFFFLLIFQVYRTNFISFLKIFRVIVGIPLIIMQPIMKYILKKTELTSYSIEGTIVSTTTQIFFTRSKRIGISICMKLWPKRRLEDSSSEDPSTQLENLLEGFAFNRRFAPGVYLGIAPASTPKAGSKKILRGDLIVKPNLNNMKLGEYVIVMREIQKKWKLDYQLSTKRYHLSTRRGMEFLAHQVVYMHKRLSQGESRPETIDSKLAFNIKRLGQAIEEKSDTSMKAQYDYICRVMSIACNYCASYFEQRCLNGHIKRCHGDLKTTNLWISPWRILPRKLFAIDCIDFKADFCHIDTLSDIAMLAVDIQQVMSSSGVNDAEELRRYFLEIYCKKMQENDVCIQLLLNYYMVEKAMVCSYVSMLLDNSLELGKRYFAIAYQLARELEREHLLFPPISADSLEQELTTIPTS